MGCLVQPPVSCHLELVEHVKLPTHPPTNITTFADTCDTNDTNDVTHPPKAMHMAAATGMTAVVKVLVESGAKVNARNLEWETPLHLAAECGAEDLVE